jgi:adenosylcobinamide-GDP ribazoletransferase
MKRQFNLFLHALSFYSRIPAGKIDYSEENLTKAFRYFPLVGILAGAAGAGAFWLSRLLFPPPVAPVMAMIAMTLITGALHEDGLSDFFDGFGGGRDRERVLSIMKDSSAGVYGVVALILLFLLKFVLLLSIAHTHIAATLVAAHASSRITPIILVNCSRYARTENGKAMHARRSTGSVTLLVALAFGLAPLLFLPWQVAATIVPLYALIVILLKKYTEKKIGGFTGDVLGALQQFSELAFYLVCAGIYPLLQ